MARPVSNGERNIRQTILVEATRLMAARGFDGTSLQAVAEAVGVRKQSLLYHFPSKEDLHAHVLRDLLSHWNEVLPRLALAVTGRRRRVEAIIRAVYDFFLEDPDRARLLMRESLDRPEQMQQLLGEQSQVWMKAIADLLRQGQKEGVIYEEVDPEAFVIQMTHLIVTTVGTNQSMSKLMGAGSDQESLDRQVKEVLRIARTALAPPRAERDDEE